MRTPTPEQQKVIDSWGQGMAVLAGAGSGKTTTLVDKCAKLLERNPKARFAAVSFTEKSASDLRAKLSERLLTPEGDGLNAHWVMTIHSLCGAILREFPREAGYDGEETMLSEGESQILWERAVEQVWSDDAQPEIEAALERLLARESRDSLWGLLRRARDLVALGILGSLASKKDPDSQALSVLAGFVLERYDRLKRRRGALDFNDLEHGADRALENPAVREAFQRRFDLVMVDEFQDTNPVQARIILRFVKPDRSNLCVVGDPKQSIYRFRDADVSVFEDFCSKLPVNLSLTWNFRSRPGILELTNQVCEKTFEASPESVKMRYERLIPKKAPGDFEPVVRLDVDSPQDLAGWIRSECDKGVQLQDMALLLRKIRGNEHWLKALIAAGIPIAVGSGGLFWEDPRTRELVALLKWWENPSNSLSGATFLRAPWVGIPDVELDRWVAQDPTFQTPFFASNHMLARALSPLLGKIIRPAELLMALIDNVEEAESQALEAELGSTLLGLWHRVEDLSSRGLDYGAVVAEISHAVEERRREREVPPPRNRGQLCILTMHGSKGLEFPHVILVDLGKKTRAPNSPTLFWDRNSGAFLVKKDSEGERIDDPELEEWKARERSKEVAESKRVFYVALTRAEERLVLVCPQLTEREAKFDPGKVFDEDFWRGWLEVSGALAQAAEAKPPIRSADEKVPPPMPLPPVPREPVLVAGTFPATRPRHSVTEWNLLARCPRSYEWTYIRPKLGAKPDREPLEELVSLAEDSGEEITQRELGTEVHACLESGDYERLDELEKKVGSERFQAARVREWAEESPLMNPAKGMLKSAWTELAFEIPVAGTVLVGSMDRVIQTVEGSFSVVDFKVTRRGKSPKALLDAYGAQMELYRWALGKLQDTGKIGASLVNFSESSVEEVQVAAKAFSVEELATHATRIVAGEEGAPRPSDLCKVCRFAKQCQPEI